MKKNLKSPETGQKLACKSSMNISVNPLGEVVAGLERSLDLSRVHVLVLAQVLGILPLKELHAVLCLCLAPEVAVGSSFLILRLPKCKRNSNGTGTTIELNLDDICDVHWCQSALLSAISLYKE